MSAHRFLNAVLLILAGVSSVHASHYEVLTPDDKRPIQCLVQDLRHPHWSSAHYLACYSQYFSTKEKWGGYFYGGFVGKPGADRNLLQFCSWQMRGKDVPPADIDFVHAGEHMSWAKTTWEGSAGGIKGMWAADVFKENEWHRFVARTWAPLDDPKHSCVGIWMKDLRTGVWNHLATTRYPGVIVNLNHFFGFQENFAGGRADPIAHLDIRNTYSLREGQWVADNTILFRPQGDGEKKERLCLKTIDGGKAATLKTLWSYVDKATPEQKADASFVPEKQQITYNQPKQPGFFDPVKVKTLAAAALDTQLYVKWELEQTSCPQVGYKLEVFDNAECKGAALKVMEGNDPGTTSLLIDVPAGKASHVRLSLTDIYGNAAPPIIRTASTSKPKAAYANAAATVPGLGYRYFEAPEKTDWMALPDFNKLTPVREGSVSEPDLSPRLRRTGYAFAFDGLIDIAKPGIHDFTVVHASGAKLSIDGQVVVQGDGYHSIRKLSGAVPLAAGKHRFQLEYVQGPEQGQQPDDFLQVLWRTPGSNEDASRVPVTVFSRKPAEGEPRITITPVAAATGDRVSLKAEVSGTNEEVKAVEYHIANPSFDYFRGQGAQGGDYFIGSTSKPQEALDTMLWGSREKTLHARLIYGNGRTIDSVPVTIRGGAPDLGPWTLSELEHHQYPVAAEVKGDSITMVGESMALLTRRMDGDCTLTARLADITRQVKAPDGSQPGGSVWQAGIILRNDLDPSPGEPLGGNTTYAALLGCADGSIRDCDSLMKNGAGNQPSGNRGSNKRWMRLERKGNEVIESLSEDGKSWAVNKTVTLPKLAPSIHAGFFIYALPSSTRLLHRATFDQVKLETVSGK